MPKSRYDIMRGYMPKVGGHGLDMMLRTCTIQANLDFSDEADMVKKMRVGLALQPVVTAIFANSPFTEGRPNGFQSFRSEIWLDTDPDRTGMLPWAFDAGFGFESYVDWALDVPMYFVKRGARYFDVTGTTFRSYMSGSLDNRIPDNRPTLADWKNHLSTLFPEVRLKNYLEMRGADGGPRHLLGAGALGRASLRRRCARRGVELIKDWSSDEVGHILHQGHRWAFHYDIRGNTANDDVGFKFDAHKFAPAEYVSLTEQDGVLRTFRVVSVQDVD